MIAAYGAARPTSAGVKGKVASDLNKAKSSWGGQMTRWAFIHNNAVGLPLLAAEAVIALKAAEAANGLTVEVWPPQVLWNETFGGLTRDALVRLIGIPPSTRPAAMSYIATAIRSLARVERVPNFGETLPVPEHKIEFNEFADATANLIRQYQVHTHLVRYYFDRATPGEQFQVAENLRNQYNGLAATVSSPDSIFHALCDLLIEEAFDADAGGNHDEHKSAALLVITHFFESCLIFEMPEEHAVVLAE
ncbi:hypothetical protein IWX81_002925 [Salinibacterium sp. CAN_S4]|uniref:ABC-three component system protein n=1 Tax=Salinibacterium sp. CAN_S4 TaxID=2787727 RepID=UPI001A2A3246